MIGEGLGLGRYVSLGFKEISFCWKEIRYGVKGELVLVYGKYGSVSLYFYYY